MDNKNKIEGKIQIWRVDHITYDSLGYAFQLIGRKRKLRNKYIMLVLEYVDIILCEFSIGVYCIKWLVMSKDIDEDDFSKRSLQKKNKDLIEFSWRSTSSGGAKEKTRRLSVSKKKMNITM